MSILSSMLPSAAAHANETVCQLFSFIQLQGNTDYIGEKVSQLEHSLQCAYLATQDSLYKHDPEVILGALLHDVGRFIPAAKDMPKMIAPDGSYVGRCSHEVLGERYLRQLGFSDKICQLVGAHVMAKRYLTAVEAGYFDSLSKTSKQTLVYQGGSFTDKQIEEARRDPLLAAKLAVRKWDDLAKDPNIKVPSLEMYKSMTIECLKASRTTLRIGSIALTLPWRRTAIIILPASFNGFDHAVFAADLRIPSLCADRDDTMRDGSKFNETDTEQRGYPSAEEIFNAANGFGLYTHIASTSQALKHAADLEVHLDYAIQPLLSGDNDVALVNLQELGTGFEAADLMPHMGKQILQLIQCGVHVIVAEDWEEWNGTAASVLCAPVRPTNTLSDAIHRRRVNIWEIAFS